MADLVTGTKQTVVFYFLTADGSSPIEIYRRVRNWYSEDSMNDSSGRRWARRFKNGEKETDDRPRSHGSDNGDHKEG